VKISCKEDVHICCVNFAKKMEQNLHETTSRWKTYGKGLFSEDLEVRDVIQYQMLGILEKNLFLERINYLMSKSSF
jgi:hypothetical protein